MGFGLRIAFAWQKHVKQQIKGKNATC
jgi:hypothetical protein